MLRSAASPRPSRAVRESVVIRALFSGPTPLVAGLAAEPFGRGPQPERFDEAVAGRGGSGQALRMRRRRSVGGRAGRRAAALRASDLRSWSTSPLRAWAMAWQVAPPARSDAMANRAAATSPRSMESHALQATGRRWRVPDEAPIDGRLAADREARWRGRFFRRAGDLTRRGPFAPRRAPRSTAASSRRSKPAAGEMGDAVRLHRAGRAVDEAPAGVERGGQVAEHDRLCAAGGEGVVPDVLAVVRRGDGVGRLEGVARR